MAFFILIGALIGVALGLYGNKGVQKAKQSKFITSRLRTAVDKDTAWDEQKLIEHVKTTFLRYQNDWSARDAEKMKAYMTPAYYRRASLLLTRYFSR